MAVVNELLRHRCSQGAMPPQFLSVPCRFVVRDTVPQTKYCCSHKIKIFDPPKIFGLATLLCRPYPCLNVVAQGCATEQHCRAKYNQIGPRAKTACVKPCGLDNFLATYGRLAMPFKYHNACLWNTGVWTK